MQNGNININMHAFREGDPKTFSEAFNFYYKQVHHYAMTIIDDEGEAEICAADSFVKLWEERTKITDDSHILAFLFKVTKRLCINRLHSKDYRNNFGHSKLDPNLIVQERRDSDVCSEAQMMEILVDLINNLPETERIVMTEAWLKGKSDEDIAIQLEKTVPHIKVIISQATAKMKLEILKTILVAISLTEICLGLSGIFV